MTYEFETLERLPPPLRVVVPDIAAYDRVFKRLTAPCCLRILPL